jgi:F-type H+-transporting ATPase subunit b
MIERARKEIERERDQAIESLRRESVELALSAASRLLHQKLDTEADRKLVEGYLGGLDGKVAEA